MCFCNNIPFTISVKLSSLTLYFTFKAIGQWAVVSTFWLFDDISLPNQKYTIHF